MSGILHVGDTRPALTGTATSNGAGTNLAGATLVLHIHRPDATLITVTPTAVSAPDGTWSYTWAGGDLTIAGTWTCELQVTFADTGIETFGPASFSVVPQIA